MRINCTYAISAQETFDINVNEVKSIKPIEYTTNILNVIEPSWKNYIPRNQLRRMGKAVRIGVGVGLKLIEENSDYKKSDAIIITSKNGGLQDCIQFLEQIMKYGDGALTPTNFVQSTPNAISGNIALATENQAYNMTHVNSSFSFIDGLRDADLLLSEYIDYKVLIGSVEEISEYNYIINQLEERYKEESINSLELLNSKTKGSICGESSVFFGLSNDTEGNKIEGYDTLLSDDSDEVIEFIIDFIKSHNLTQNEVDTLVLGFNGDIEQDIIYRTLIESNFKTSSVYSFKDLFGEHPSVISMGVWYANSLLNNLIPLNKNITTIERSINRVLIFNQFDSYENSLVLVSK
jgi:hypothetical protein